MIITSDRDLKSEPNLTPEEILMAKQQALLINPSSNTAANKIAER